MIEFENVTRAFANKVAVNGLTLNIPSGELFALLGPNGAGKTTTIKMLTGLLRPTRGTVRVCGFDLAKDVRRAARSIGYVPEEPFLYDKLSGSRIPRVHRRNARAWPLGNGETHRPRMRVLRPGRFYRRSERDLFARHEATVDIRVGHVARSAEVLVVDEPMIGLDPRSARTVKDRLRDRAAAGATVFMSTHTLAVAEEISERIGIMDHGRLHFLGTVGDLQAELASSQTSLEHLFLELTSGNGLLAKSLDRELEMGVEQD